MPQLHVASVLFAITLAAATEGTLADEVRTLDARNRTDADGNNYYVVFCARDSGADGDKPGHAFVVWGIEDSQKRQSVQRPFGFYPEVDKEKFALLPISLPGQIVDEQLDKKTREKLKFITHRLIVQVNREAYRDSQKLIEKWRTEDYNLYRKNCIAFVADVANRTGLSERS